MRALVTLALGAMLSVGAMAGEKTIEKKGFLATPWCIKHDMFKDCRLETYVCGYAGCYKHWHFGQKMHEKLALYVHDEGKVYNVDLGKILPSELDEAKNANEVTIIGTYDPKTDTIHATKFKAPPPPKKSFFKGCL